MNNHMREQEMEPRQGNRFSIGATRARSARNTMIWYCVLAPPTLIYLGIALHVALNIQPLSRYLPNIFGQIESLVLYLILTVLPLVALMACYVRRLTRKAKLARGEFVIEFDGRDLVQSAYNRNLIYLVLTRKADLGIQKMRVVWTADGRCEHGGEYGEVGENSVVKFDADNFVKV